MVEGIAPELVYVSGWMDRGYLTVARMLRSRNIPVVMGLDGQWFGTLRQRLTALLFRLFLQRCFSHAWVAGPRQYEYARRLGFCTHSIAQNLLSGNYSLFAERRGTWYNSECSCSGFFLYVGRLVDDKAIDVLAAGYRLYRQRARNPWSLRCVGNGPLESELIGQPGIEVRGFSDQKDLLELASHAGAFVLASRREPWGVVVHEFAAAGLPLLLSTAVGAGDMFLIHGYNGFLFDAGSPEALAAAMARLSAMPEGELAAMGARSRKL